MRKYELPISPNYVNNWGIKEAIRELLQNAIDGETEGYEKEIDYSDGVLTIRNYNITLSPNSLVLGCSSKTDQDNMVGKYGEGYKLALVVLLRKGLTVSIINGDKIWTPCFTNSKKFNSQVLVIKEEDSEEDEGFIEFCINGIPQNVYEKLKDDFPCIDNNFGEVVETEMGQILLDRRFRGKMFVSGLYIQSDTNFEYGYNFNSDIVELDRDRKAINYYELRALTAKSFATAEECHPKLFKAISTSVVDVRDIEEVIDEANDEFLMEYRDMFYEEKGLEDNTLVATESVMKQLQQMDLDVPVVKGSEIESYLIAKANDKLGLIQEAKEMSEKKTDVENALDNLMYSNFYYLMRWYSKAKNFLPDDLQEEFSDVESRFTPYGFSKIKEFIPENFDYSIESIKEIKRQYLEGEIGNYEDDFRNE